MNKRVMIKKIITVLVVFTMIFAISMPIVRIVNAAGAYYVAADGNDNNPGTLAQPWRTIQKAADTALAGDTVYVRGGTYNEQVFINSHSGSPDNWITFAAYPGETPIVDGTGINMNPGYGIDGGLFDVKSVSYIKITGFRIQNSGYAAIYTSATKSPTGLEYINPPSHHITFEGNTCQNTYAAAIIMFGLGTSNATDLVVRNNTVIQGHNSDDWRAHEVLSIGGGTDGFEVSGNRIENSRWGAIDAKNGAFNGNIFGNVITDTEHSGIYVDGYGDGCENINVYNNTIYNMKSVGTECNGINIASEEGGLTKNINIYNNLIYNNPGSALRTASYSTGPVQDITFANNTCYNNGNGSNDRGGISLEYDAATNVVVRNNIFSQNNAYQIYSADADAIIQNNLIDSFRGYAGETRGTDYQEGFPQFVNPFGENFHIVSTSIARDNGTSTGFVPSTDFDGVGRPQGAGYDIGAYEYNGGTETPAPTPTPDVNLALNKTVAVSSIESSSYPGSYAVDGSNGTRWASQFSDPQWIYVDLGANYNVDRVVLNWEYAYAAAYQIQISDDASNWTDVYSTANGDGNIDDIGLTPASARYVRMYGTARATQYGYSLWEFKVYGSSGSEPTPTPVPTPTPKAGSDIYYVATNGNDNNPGTQSSPWRTITKAANTMVAGNTVYIRGGDYYERVIPANSGSPGHFINYKAYPNETVTINGSGVPVYQAGAENGLVHINNKSYIRFFGLKIENSDFMGVKINGGSDVYIEDGDIINSASSGICVHDGARVYIRGNYLTLNQTMAGLPQQTNETVSLINTDGFEVSNNMFRNNNFESIDCKDGTKNGNIFGNDISAHSSAGIYIDAWARASNNINIYKNKIHDSNKTGARGIAIAVENGGSLDNVSVFNNLIYNCAASGIATGWYSNGPMSNLKIINNTVYHNGTVNSWGGGITLEYGAATNVTVRNNIVDGNNNYSIRLVRGAVATVDHNSIDDFYASEGETRGSSYQEGDPLFVDTYGSDFHIRSSSIAKDNGISLLAPAYDYDGVTRPQESGYDIGAYEYSSNGSAPAPFIAESLYGSLNYGLENSLIENTGIFNSLKAKVDNILNNRENSKKVVNGLNALQNEVLAQLGKKIESGFASTLLGDIEYMMDIYEAGGPRPMPTPEPTPTPVPTPTPLPAGSELLTNPDFETGSVSPWVTWGGSLAVDALYKYSGTYGSLTSDRSDTWRGPTQDITSVLRSQGQGDYNLETWAKLESGSDIIRVTVKLTYGGSDHYTYTDVNVGTSWTQITGTQNLKWLGTLTSAYFYVQTSTSTANLYVDDCSLKKQ